MLISVMNIQKIHNEKTDYYLRRKPWHGARPRQTGAEQPPATKDSTLKNAADIFGTLRLSPGIRVDMKEEVFTPPGGGGGGGQVPDPRGVQSEAQAMSKTVPEDTVRLNTVQITFIFIDFRVYDFAFAFKTQNAPCVSRFKRVLFSDRFQFAF